MWYRVDTIATAHSPNYSEGQIVPNLPDGHGAGWFDNVDDALACVSDINEDARLWVTRGYANHIAYFGNITYIGPVR